MLRNKGTGKSGKPFQVTSFESPTLMISKYVFSVEFSLAEGRLAVPLAQTSGNIWIMDNAVRLLVTNCQCLS